MSVPAEQDVSGKVDLALLHVVVSVSPGVVVVLTGLVAMMVMGVLVVAAGVVVVVLETVTGKVSATGSDDGTATEPPWRRHHGGDDRARRQGQTVVIVVVIFPAGTVVMRREDAAHYATVGHVGVRACEGSRTCHCACACAAAAAGPDGAFGHDGRAGFDRLLEGGAGGGREVGAYCCIKMSSQEPDRNLYISCLCWKRWDVMSQTNLTHHPITHLRSRKNPEEGPKKKTEVYDCLLLTLKCHTLNHIIKAQH